MGYFNGTKLVMSVTESLRNQVISEGFVLNAKLPLCSLDTQGSRESVKFCYETLFGTRKLELIQVNVTAFANQNK